MLGLKCFRLKDGMQTRQVVLFVLHQQVRTLLVAVSRLTDQKEWARDKQEFNEFLNDVRAEQLNKPFKRFAAFKTWILKTHHVVTTCTAVTFECFTVR